MTATGDQMAGIGRLTARGRGASVGAVLDLTRADGYLLSTDPARLDLDRVHHWLSTDAYWALGRDRGDGRPGVRRLDRLRGLPARRRRPGGVRPGGDRRRHVRLALRRLRRPGRARAAGWAPGWPARSATTWPTSAYAGSCWPPTTPTGCTRRSASRPLAEPDRWMESTGGEPAHRQGAAAQSPLTVKRDATSPRIPLRLRRVPALGFLPALPQAAPARPARWRSWPTGSSGRWSSWRCCSPCVRSIGRSCGSCSAGPRTLAGIGARRRADRGQLGHLHLRRQLRPGGGDRARLLHQPAGRRCCSAWSCCASGCARPSGRRSASARWRWPC